MWLLLWLAASAQSLEQTPFQSLTLRFDSRYDTIAWGRERHRLQNSALVRFELDLFADITLGAMASTGPRFQSRWSTWRDLNGGEPERMALSLRQLYLQRWFGDVVRVQLGSIPPVKGRVSATGLEDIGWIDGGRGEVHLPHDLVVEVVGGSLTDVNEPDLFIRRRDLDYFETEVGWHPAGVDVEAAFHILGANRYAKGEVGWSGSWDDGRTVSVAVEGAVELRSGATQAVISARTDVGTLITGDPRTEDFLTLRSLCRWVDPDYGVFGTLSEDFYQFGTECRVRLDGRFDRKGRLGWNLRYIAPVSEDLDARFTAALTARFREKRSDAQ